MNMNEGEWMRGGVMKKVPRVPLADTIGGIGLHLFAAALANNHSSSNEKRCDIPKFDRRNGRSYEVKNL